VSVGSRLTVAGLGAAGAAFVVGIALVPTHVTFGAGSLPCGTVLHPDRTSEISAWCGAAGAHHLRAALAVGVVLVVLALVPVAIQRVRPPFLKGVWVVWGMIFVLVAVAGFASAAMVKFAPKHAPEHEVFEL